MPSNISFKGASNFTISGGNFGGIGGGVVNYNFGRGFEITRTNAFAEYVDVTGTGSETRYSSRSGHMLAQRRNTSSPPPRARIKPAPHRSDSAPVPRALLGSGSSSHSESTPRAPTPPPTPLDQSSPSSPTSSTISSLTGYLTPSSECSVNQLDGINADLTLLTESLGLNSQLAPNPRIRTLSSGREALVNSQEEVDVRPPVTKPTEESNIQLPMESSRAPDTSHIGKINSQPILSSHFEPGTSVNDFSVGNSSNRETHNRLGPPPPLPPRPMVPSTVPGTTGTFNMARYRMQNYIEPLPRTSSPEPMQPEQRDSSSCLQRRDMSVRANTGDHTSSHASSSAQPQARDVYTTSSLNIPAQQDVPTVPQDICESLAGTSTLSTVSELSMTEGHEPHWTPNSIENWVDDVEGGEDTDTTEQRRRDFRPSATLADRQHVSQTDQYTQSSVQDCSFHRYGQYADYPNYNSGCFGIPQYRGVPLHHPYFLPYSFSNLSLNPPVPQGHPYGGGVIYVPPWSSVWQ